MKSTPRRRQAGFSLVELTIATAVSGVLASVAYPSYSAVAQKMRRTEALVSMIQVQQAQERWRSGNGRYGTIAEIGAAGAVAGRSYDFSVGALSASGYEVLAVATGAQARDIRCRFLRLVVDGGNVSTRSGSDDATDNPPQADRKCWNV
ncbi:MAG TPA: type IV pilin protein [Burkholderiaceae bacterium]|jgi:type IV pilus assembly protein PilE|nr:type IV pilin protein [Burkholderiaceae bacterium]